MTNFKFRSFIIFVLFASSTASIAEEKSTCYGSTQKGRLDHGVKLPSKGDNFISYGTIPELTGRTYVHSTVKKIVINAYRQLEKTQTNKVYKYAETGLKHGGLFKPHKTHQNGLSIDFMVPVVDIKTGQSVHLATTPINRYGYDIHFDKKGRHKNLKIDFEAMAAHIVALHKEALKRQAGIWRVLFAPDLQPYLYATTYSSYIKNNIKIPNKQSWVRHDEHYHVDFDVKCHELK